MLLADDVLIALEPALLNRWFWFCPWVDPVVHLADAHPGARAGPSEWLSLVLGDSAAGGVRCPVLSAHGAAISRRFCAD